MVAARRSDLAPSLPPLPRLNCLLLLPKTALRFSGLTFRRLVLQPLDLWVLNATSPPRNKARKACRPATISEGIDIVHDVCRMPHAVKPHIGRERSVAS